MLVYPVYSGLDNKEKDDCKADELAGNGAVGSLLGATGTSATPGVAKPGKRARR